MMEKFDYPGSKTMPTGISRWLMRALGVFCLALPLALPPAAAATKAKPHAAAKGKHKVAAKHAKKAKAAKYAKKASPRKIAKAHGPKAKPHRQPPAAALETAKGQLALADQPEAPATIRTARTACAIDGKIYLLADCQQVAAN